MGEWIGNNKSGCIQIIIKMGISMMGGLFGNITSDVQNLVPHASREESKTLHAFDEWWNVSYLNMWLGEYVHWWNLMNVVIRWIVWNMYMSIFVIFGESCSLDAFIDDDYVSENIEVWIMCIWFGDFLGDDDFLAYTFEMMNRIYWIYRQEFMWSKWLTWSRWIICNRWTTCFM